MHQLHFPPLPLPRLLASLYFLLLLLLLLLLLPLLTVIVIVIVILTDAPPGTFAPVPVRGDKRIPLVTFPNQFYGGGSEGEEAGGDADEAGGGDGGGEEFGFLRCGGGVVGFVGRRDWMMVVAGDGLGVGLGFFQVAVVDGECEGCYSCG